MIYYLIVCRSLTYAQRTAKTLERAGITAIVIKTPQNVTAEGCGYCVKISERRLTEALTTLRRYDLAPKRVFIQQSDGNVGEIAI